MKLEFFQQVFKKYSNIRFHANLSMGAELFCGDERMDIQRRHYEANSCFCTSANVPKSFDYITVWKLDITAN
jgi:hypothetical protein